MANPKFFPFDSVENDRAYLSQDFADYFRCFIGDGVYNGIGDSLQVFSLDESMVVTVKPGAAMLEGRGYLQEDNATLQISAAHASYARYDLIVLQLDYINRFVGLAIKAGTASANPAKPVIQRDSDIFELELAEIYVENGVTKITQANITDKRIDSTVCGWVSGLINQVDTTTIFNQYYAKWQEVLAMMNANKEEYDAWYTEFKRLADAQLQAQANEYTADKAERDAWFTENQAAIFDAQYFDFDNPAYRAGMEYSYEKTTSGASTIIIEQWTILADGSIYATRTNEKETSGKWTVSTVCDCLGVNIKVVWDKGSGSWKGEVESCPIL